MRPATAKAIDTDLRTFAGFVIEHDPALGGAGDVERSHIEAFKLWQWAQPGRSGQLKPATFRRRMGHLRTFFLRITEWGWHDAPPRVPIFFGDVPKRDDSLPRFLDDARFTQFMRALAAEARIRRRVAIELLARTGMRIGELCALEADAVTIIGDAHWLRVPLGKATSTPTSCATPWTPPPQIPLDRITYISMLVIGCCLWRPLIRR